MTHTLFLVPAAQRVRQSPRLSRVWIETGNPRQPLAAVWINDAWTDGQRSTEAVPLEEPALPGWQPACA